MMNTFVPIAAGAFFILLGWGLVLRQRKKRKPPKGFQETEPPF